MAVAAMDHLTAMGFSASAAKNALRLSGDDLGAAADMLLNSSPAEIEMLLNSSPSGHRAASTQETDLQKTDSQVRALMAMGFDAIASRNALNAVGGNLERAADVLLTGDTQVVEVAAPSRREVLAEPSPQRRRIERADDAERAVMLQHAQDRALRHSQDQEFKKSELTDRLKELAKRQGPLKKELADLDAEVDEAEKIRKHAAQRLAQFGGLNPKLAQESEHAAERLAAAAERRHGLEAELKQIDAEVVKKEKLLAAM